MGSKLPVLSGREVVRIFATFGWQVARQASSHIIMTKAGEMVTLSIPDHREVARGTLRSFDPLSKFDRRPISGGRLNWN